MNIYEWLATLTPPELAEWLGKIACPPGDEPFDCTHEGVCTICWIHYLMKNPKEGEQK